ncbi:MFS transporter [Pseudorhodoplanes sp.]|uniref:MFS transporter n=1 Tax=Pseudorhodoplanes sp. TaxID=1934341 RepID=UPI002B79275F|nr:MFS transporter [Pseudorhodoplanes sp.]HWV52396.1 MFS transporter [Pseudorhodoplanes sp.]
MSDNTAGASGASSMGWRTPLIVILAGCAISLITFGPRSATGLFMQPVSEANGWGRDVFALAFAVQNLLWGLGQPIAGAVADRFGTLRVLCGGALLYAAGLVLMVYSTTPLTFNITVGVMIGFGLSGCSFNLVVAALGKLVPEDMRSLAFGAGTAAGSFGQFLFAPLGAGLIAGYGWPFALFVFAAAVLLVLPFSLALATAPASTTPVQGADAPQSLKHALSEAFAHRSYVLLVLGFFTCGFQLAFITAHLPAYLVDRGLSVQVGGWVIATIGLFNIVGSLTAGWAGNRMPKRYILAFLYFMRAASIAIFISVPLSTTTALLFAVSTGLTWLSTVPPTSGLVALMFGTRWLAMLFGFAFFSHQVGGFLGVWLGGLAFEMTGSYNLVWILSIAFGVASAIINLPIVEEPVKRQSASAMSASGASS